MIKIPEHVEAVLFDLDGTLVDSMGMWKQIDIDFLGRYGLPLPEDLQECIEGLSFRETAVYFINRFSLPMDEAKIMEIWNDMAYDAYANTVPLKPGVREFLEYLSRKEIPMGIVTSNSERLMNACLTATDIRKYFRVFVDGTRILRGKPAPDGYLTAASMLSVHPENCLVFEDVPQGIQAGKSAGMTVWAVEDSYSAWLRDKKEAMADHMVDSYYDILTEDL